ncbi:MAG: macrocin O-methyltransferase, partial [Bacteroidetes bacterium]|nr:macrocin O-methyltransferase [Bacteroidota bacterium]
YIIIDDWGAVEGCKLAVLDYRKQNNITAEIVPIDLDGIYWKKLY